MDDILIARLVAAGRVLFGTLCLAIPRVVLGRAGREASPQIAYMIRIFGVRDIVLGSGALLSLNDDNPDSTWVAFGAAADTADAVTAIAFREDLGPAVTGATLGLAVPAALLGWKATLGLRRR